MRTGVVHFGPGAFHRAHQAHYFDRMLAHDLGWGVSAVALRRGSVAEALTPQDGLYVLVEQAQAPRLQIIGALREVLNAPNAADQVFQRLASPDLRLVTATVTEKG